MFSDYRKFASGVLLLLALSVVAIAGCETTAGVTTPSSASIVDDARIASDVRSRLVTDSATSYSSVGVTSTNGVVALTGTVDSSARAARAARLASEVAGVRQVVNSLQVASVSAPSTVVVTPAPSSVVTATPAVSIAPQQPPIDASGVVSRYDPQTGTLTFQDGRMVRVTNSSRVWGPASPGVLQPGANVFVRNAEPVGYRPVTTQPGVGAWRMGTVNRVDALNNMIYLNDGSVVHVPPSGLLGAGGRPMAMTEIFPGSQIAIGIPAQPVTVPPPATATLGSVSPSPSYGDALPRQVVTPIESSQVHVIVLP